MYSIAGITDDMRFVKGRSLCLMLASLCTACYARAQSQASQADFKAFVTEYVAEYNAKDAARLLALYDSKSRACITAEDKDFYDAALAAMWRDPIPAKYTFTVSPVNENNLKAIETFGRFPLKPARELHIDYQQSEDVGGVDVYLVQQNGRWLVALKQFLDDAPARREREARSKSLAAAIQEPLRSQLIALLREHKTAEAIDRYKEASGQDVHTAMSVIYQLAHEPTH